MGENKSQGHSSEKRSRCEINDLFDGASCTEPPKEKVDRLHLCERHALETKLEGQIECWGEMLFHIDLWSKGGKREERAEGSGVPGRGAGEGEGCKRPGEKRFGLGKRRDTPLGA